MAPSLSQGRVHGGVQQEERHRHGARAVQGRRRRGQQHAHRHDADRDLRHRQPDPVHPRRQDRRPRGRQRHSVRRSPPKSRPSRRAATPSISRRRSSASMRRPARRSRSSTNSMPAIVKVASNPEFQKRHMIARGLAPVLNSPEEFAKAASRPDARSRAWTWSRPRASIRTSSDARSNATNAVCVGLPLAARCGIVARSTNKSHEGGSHASMAAFSRSLCCSRRRCRPRRRIIRTGRSG